jgi:hypothetical protein
VSIYGSPCFMSCCCTVSLYCCLYPALVSAGGCLDVCWKLKKENTTWHIVYNIFLSHRNTSIFTYNSNSCFSPIKIPCIYKRPVHHSLRTDFSLYEAASARHMHWTSLRWRVACSQSHNLKALNF